MRLRGAIASGICCAFCAVFVGNAFPHVLLPDLILSGSSDEAPAARQAGMAWEVIGCGGHPFFGTVRYNNQASVMSQDKALLGSLRVYPPRIAGGVVNIPSFVKRHIDADEDQGFAYCKELGRSWPEGVSPSSISS